MRGAASFYEDRPLMPLGARNVSTSSPIVRSGGAKGAFFIVHVKTAVTSNLLFRISALEIFEGNFYQITQNVTITAAGDYVIAVGPGVALQPAGEAADTTHANVVQAVGTSLPDQWRLSMNKGDASVWEYGVSVRLVA